VLRPLRFVLALAMLSAAVPSPAAAASTYATAGIFDLSIEDSGPNEAAVGFDGLVGEFAASASVDYGSLAARVHYQVDEFSRALAAGGTIVAASAQAIDTITVTGGSGAGSLELTFSFSGFAVDSDPAIVRGEYLFSANTPETTFLRVRSLHGVLDGLVVRDAIPFVFGQPFSLGLQLQVLVEQIQEGGPPPFAPLLATLDYAAIRWVGSAVFDAQGAPLPGFAIVAESGTSYPITVPEPQGHELALASVAALALARRRG